MDNPGFEHIFEQGLGSWKEGSVFVAAVSGGADSTAMLLALSGLAGKRHYQIHCLHVRHNIRSREEGEKDALAVRALCRRLGIPCRIVSIKPGKIEERARELGTGIEAAARDFRHAAFRHEARRVHAEMVLIAHNREDALENVLIRVLRGGGPGGLALMPRANGYILRPLLQCSRADILAYLAKMNTGYRTDSSNNDNRYLRNRIRNVLIPCLDANFPGWRKGLESMGTTQALTAEHLAMESINKVEWRECADIPAFETQRYFFDELDYIVREEAVFRGIDLAERLRRERGRAFSADIPRRLRPPRRAVIRNFLAGDSPVLDLGAYRIEKSEDVLRIGLREEASAEKGFSLCIKKPGSSLFMGYSILAGDNGAGEADFYCELPLVFRSPLAGEKMDAPFHGKGTEKMKNGMIIEDINGKIAYIGIEKDSIKILLYKELHNAASCSGKTAVYVKKCK